MKQRPTILAIDDTPMNLRTLGGVLQADYDLQIATSGAQGLKLAAQAAPDLILLDIMMPDMDGYEVMRRLRASEALSRIPVVFITALAENEAEAQGLDLGANDYLTKPINVPIAQLRIRNILEREALRRKVERHRDQLEEQVRERTLALSIAKEAADAGNRAKTTLLRNVTHELRTPLSALMGMIGIAKRRTHEALVTDPLRKAEVQAERLLAMVDNLIEMARIEAGQLSLAQTPFGLAWLIEGAMATAQPLASAKGLELELFWLGDTAAADDVLLNGDPLRLQIVVSELLGNAIKFSDAGKVTLLVRPEFTSDSVLRLDLEVADEGPGIAGANPAWVFNAFEQQDGSLSRRHGGNGIGLYLCRNLIKLMGGEIGVTSRPGHGSRFGLSVELPVVHGVAGAAKPVDPTFATQLRQRCAGLTVLVVDPDPDTQSEVKASLESCGLVVFAASNGTEALALAHEVGVDLILAAMQLPDMSVPELAYSLRSKPDGGHFAILALTERPFADDREACLRAGINAHVPKPITPVLLQESALTWLVGQKPVVR